MDLDLSVYLGAFLDEVDEQLEILEKEVLNLEKDPKNVKTIQSIFRAAHTLKGSSAAMGIEKMKELTHKIENVFDSIRNQQLHVDAAIINVIFESIDLIKRLKEAIIDGAIDSIDISDLIAKLEWTKNNKLEDGNYSVNEIEGVKNDSDDTFFPEVILDEYQKDIVEKAFELGMNAIVVYVVLNDKSLLKSVRAFLIHNNLKELGEIIASFPAPEVIEDEEKFEGSLAFIIVTNVKNKEVFNVVNSISDIKAIHLTLLTSSNLASYCVGKKMGIVEQSSLETEENGKKSTSQVKVNPTVRIDVKRLEELMNLVGELVISQTRLTDVRGRLAERYSSDPDIEGFQEVENNFGQIISELQERIMKTRMLPIEQLFNRFPRMVRDLAQKSSKEVNFIIEGKETELDRNLIEEIADPIIHLLRNSLDHGIEPPEEREGLGKNRQGTVMLKAAHEENHIVVTISDDGKGIDTEKIKQSAIKKHLIKEDEVEQMTEKDLVFLIFKSGVSTAQTITDISGRGVGMDIVRSHIEKLNGMIDIQTKVGEGTTFTIKLPLTLAIIRSLLVQIGEKQFAIPLVNVQEIIRLSKEEIKTIQNQEVGIVRDRVLPLVRLHKRLDVSEDNILNKKRIFVVVLGLAEKRVGVIIDKTLGNQEIVIKSLGKYIGTPKYIAGATIMGDGNVTLILDVGSIVNEEGTQDVTNNLPSNETRRNEKILQLTTFRLGDEEYGIVIDKVKDIITVPTITPVINSPFSIIGMMNLRGKLIPVMDLRERFGICQQQLTRKSRVMVVQVQNELIGLLVDQVTQVLKVNEELMEHAPRYESQIEEAYIQGICHLEERLIILLNIDRVIGIERLLQLKQLADQ
ncbi:chemotaxis protein CheA [Schinkia azotoformans]|uniref:chemotaxis protein CheA n=1 Tax=Schinkia azotoformans TaxID=1454 RepID=UPI002DBD6EB3|nr:chemotaxis protein CheA [Schinkia azotoformans]MEC1772363.1 chemotaxis protein CheA [Schinkia azotoformans]MED4365876.1 chemotaxis protein CheA [Schinkia azotoformans]